VGVHGNVKIRPLLDGPEKGLTGGASRASPDSTLKKGVFITACQYLLQTAAFQPSKVKKKLRLHFFHMSQSKVS
jgi:hypothetical protein